VAKPSAFQLATNLGSSLVGALYVLDEPSIGLHPRDSERLIRLLHNLRDIGNTVLVVEHDPEICEQRTTFWISALPRANLAARSSSKAANPELLTDKASLTAVICVERLKSKPRSRGASPARGAFQFAGRQNTT